MPLSIFFPVSFCIATVSENFEVYSTCNNTPYLKLDSQESKFTIQDKMNKKVDLFETVGTYIT